MTGQTSEWNKAAAKARELWASQLRVEECLTEATTEVERLRMLLERIEAEAMSWSESSEQDDVFLTIAEIAKQRGERDKK